MLLCCNISTVIFFNFQGFYIVLVEVHVLPKASCENSFSVVTILPFVASWIYLRDRTQMFHCSNRCPVALQGDQGSQTGLVPPGIKWSCTSILIHLHKRSTALPTFVLLDML